MDRTIIPPINSLEAAAGARCAGRSDVGRSRSENQDYMGLFRAEGQLLAVVADGMGGHSGGYEASRIAVDALRATMVEHSGRAPADLLRFGIELAHSRIREAAAGTPDLDGMGTTLVAVLVTNGTAWIAHVGDSRAYAVRAGRAYLLTLDHSRVHRMLLEGMIDASQVANHPMGHILERSVGASATVEPDVRVAPVSLRRGDRIVLCSDGVWSVVNDDEIARLASFDPLTLAAESLIGVALARMADDNATIMLLDVLDSGLSTAALEDVRTTHGFGPPTQAVSAPAPGTSKAPARPRPVLRPAPRRWKWMALGLFIVALCAAAVATKFCCCSSESDTPKPNDSEERRRQGGSHRAGANHRSEASSASETTQGSASGDESNIPEMLTGEGSVPSKDLGQKQDGKSTRKTQ